MLTHGYNGSVTLFYKSIKSLSEKFYLILFDIIGMGGSSRPDFRATHNGESDNFFMQVFEEWRIALGLSGFYLAGHSFGGYLMGTYAALYPLHIKKLILLSPLGIKRRPENFKAKNMFYPEGYGPPNWAKGISEKRWGKIVPMNIAKRVGTEKLSKKMI